MLPYLEDLLKSLFELHEIALCVTHGITLHIPDFCYPSRFLAISHCNLTANT